MCELIFIGVLLVAFLQGLGVELEWRPILICVGIGAIIVVLFLFVATLANKRVEQDDQKERADNQMRRQSFPEKIQKNETRLEVDDARLKAAIEQSNERIQRMVDEIQKQRANAE